jgi:hypothetical protein
MADGIGVFKGSIGAGDKIVSAIQSGNIDAFWAAAKDGVLATTALCGYSP